MQCPNCLSGNIRRSRRRGLREGLALRLKHQAPYRCPRCGLRFVAAEDDGAAVKRQLALADYLGLQGPVRKMFSDRAILGSLALALILLFMALIFAFSFGWIEPPSFLPERELTPKAARTAEHSP